jgi:hypothetical protein
MQMRAPRFLAAPFLALVLIAAPAFSSPKDDKNANWNGSNDNYVTGKVKVMQVISDKDFSRHDLERILPLLQDLRDARMACDAKCDAFYADMSLHHGDKAAYETKFKDCERACADSQRNTWNTIGDKIGADKANALRTIVEPHSEDVSKVTYTSVHLQRIDTMLQELDKMAAARIAANGGTPDNSGVRPASVETVTTVTTRVEPAFAVTVTSPAVATEGDLVNAVQEKILFDELGKSEAIWLAPHGDIKSTDLTFLREENLKVWW